MGRRERKKSDSRGWKTFGYPAFSFLFWIGVWAFLAWRVGTEFFLPAPSAVVRSLWALLPTVGFWRTVGLSLLRILCGYLPGVLLGALGGILTAKLPVADALFSPALTVIRATPVASFILLVLAFFGRERVPSLIVFLMVLPIVWANTAEGVCTVDRSLAEVCRVYGMSRGRKWKILILPHVMPYFSAGALTALGLGWKAGIAAEVLSTPKWSVGKQMYDAKVYMETADLFAWTVVVILLSLALEKGLKFLLKRRKTV